MEDENLKEPPPPSPARVASRSIVLSAVSCRGFAEGDTTDPKGAAELAKKSSDWLQAIGVEEEISDWERRVLASPLGSLSDRDRINASWLSEAVCVLAWALGRLDLPSVDQQCNPAAAANSLGFLQPAGETVLSKPQLRAVADIQDYNEFIYNVHWRVRDFSLNRRTYDFEALARKAWGEPLIKYGISFCEKDLCVAGVPLAKAKEIDWRRLASITQERHRASNWLIGYASEEYYEVTTDT